VNGGEVGDEGEESLEDLELYLYVDTLRHAVVHRLDDSWDRREGDGVQGDETLEGTEGDGDNFSIFRCAAHEDGRRRCSVWQPSVVIKSDSGSLAGILYPKDFCRWYSTVL
jgi:hypothetical protein